MAEKPKGVYVPVDVLITDDPAINEVGMFGFALYVSGLCYAKRRRTNGFVPVTVLSRLLVNPSLDELDHLTVTAKALTESGLWTSVEGGYQIRSWGAWNPTDEDRSAWSGRQKASRARHADVTPSHDAVTSPSRQVTREGKGREDKGREVEGKESKAKTAAAVAAPSEKNGFPPDWTYLLDKLHEAGWADHGKGALTWGSIHKFSTEFGERVVDGALRTLQIEPPSPLGAHPYFGATCARIAAEGAA